MPGLPDLWKLLREVDFAAIRSEAERTFRIATIAEGTADAELAAVLLGGGESRHPWLVVHDAAESPDPHALPDVALLVSRSADLLPRLALVAERLGGQRVPLATCVLGASDPLDGVVRPGEAARAAVPALDGAAAPALAQALLSSAPRNLRLALARQLPPLRPAQYTALIEETARANALYAFSTGVAESVPILNVPLNLADIVVLTKNQLAMSYRIALASGKSGSPRAVVGEVLGVIGSGFLLRQLARQLVGLIPVVGIAPKVAVAYAGTWAVGRAVAAWASGSGRISAAAVKRFSAEAAERGRQIAASLAGQAQRLGRGR